MGKFGYVMNRLSITRAVYDGVLTDDQIEAETNRFGLNEEEKKEVRKRLKDNPYIPYVYEDEEIPVEEKKAPVPEKSLSEREMYEKLLVTENKDVFIKTLEECNKKMEENERYRELYLLDEKVFINEIYAQKDDAADKPWYKMIAAVEKVNEERAERIRKKEIYGFAVHLQIISICVLCGK